MLRHIIPNNSAKKNASKGWVFSIRILASLISILFAFSAQAAFHSSSVIESLSANHQDDSHKVTNLSDGKKDTYYYSGATTGWTEAAYLEIDVKDGMLSEDDAANCLVVMVTRHNQNSADLAAAHPTAFQVEGLFGDKWEPLFYTYFLYRGGSTTEFSERIPVENLWKDVEVDPATGSMTAEADSNRSGKTLTKLRFTVLSNNQNQAHESGDNSYHSMALSSFDVVMLPMNAELPGGFSNRFHLSTDYLKDIHDFTFENTKGILNPHNAVSAWSFEPSDTTLLKDAGIDVKLPNYDLLNSRTSKYPLDPRQERQPAHTVEHIMYAIPGDIVTLYPYYELYKTPKFQINYSHWYDYKTGGRLQYSPAWSNTSYDLLDFLADPSKIQVTDEHGFFGGQHLNVETHVIKTVDDWIKLTNEMNASKKASELKDEPVYYYIELEADLNFEGRDSVAMMGNTTARPFAYHLNGKGHTIKNLKISYSENGGVGIIRYSADGAIIENLNIDSSCTIEGKFRVGLVGEHRGGRLTFRNVHTEATVFGRNTDSEQAAAGLLGFGSIINNNVLVIEDCYVGGKVGNPDTNIANSNNAALVAWWETDNNTAPVTLRNVIVDCDLTGFETANKYKKYIRHRRNTEAITEGPDGTKTKAIFTFQNCYGNIDPDDQCWQTTNQDIQIPNEKISNLIEAGWADPQTPPMVDDFEVNLSEYPYTRHYSAGNAKQYIEAVNAINNRTDSVKVYFYLTNDIDFSGYAEDEVPMLGNKSETAFNGFLNGQGHTIKHLTMKRTGNDNYVGIVRYASDGIRIENLILDESCYFEGPRYVSLVGTHLGGSMKVSNYKTEATFIGTHPSEEQCAAGILGINKEEKTDNVINFSDIYIGGKIGNPDAASHTNPYNAALVGWLENKQLDALPMSKSHLYRIVVKCELNYPENTNGKKYIRHRKEKAQLSENKENHIITKANFEFDACYGRIDLTDKCWREDENETVLQREGWADNANPPMESVETNSSLESGYATVHIVNSVESYKTAVEAVASAASSADICISIRTNLDFTGVTDVPLIGESQAKAFRGFINGNGHTIKNLTVKRTGSEAGLICWAGDGVRIENLIIDSSCLFEADTHAGLIGRLVGGTMTVKNVKTEATVRGNNSGEQAVGAIVGYCGGEGAKKTDNVLNLYNVYIGGKVGNPEKGKNNGAISGWFENEKNNYVERSFNVLKNVVVKCELYGAEITNLWKKYIRHRQAETNIPFIQSDEDGYSVKGNFKFKNCYGNIDPTDKCWHTYMPTNILGWNNIDLPPMVTNMNVNLTEYPYTCHYSACDAEQYAEMVEAINKLQDRNVYFELTDDIDFSGYNKEIPMLGKSENEGFNGFLNGNGYTIKNLNISQPNSPNVGVIRFAADGVRIENIIFDSTCKIVGQKNVGIVGSLKSGYISVTNLNSYTTVMGTASGEQSAGGLIGMTPGGNNGVFCMKLKNVHIGGVVGDENGASGNKNGGLAGWFEGRSYKSETWEQSVIENIVVDCKLYFPDTSAKNKFIRHYNPGDSETKIDDVTYVRRHIKFINCFGSPEIDDKDVCWLPLTVKSELTEFPTLEGWNNKTTPGIHESSNLEKLQNNIGDRTPGTSATFLFPWCPYLDKKEQTELSFPNGDDEYVIAADFSQRFDIDNNLDKDGKTLYEPIISVRHIFRIRDGREFADQLSGSVASNKEYLRKNLKIVSARGGVPFQIRLTTPVPVTNEKNGRCNYYYKLGEGQYAHVSGMGIRVLDGETRAEMTNPGFGFAEQFAGVGTRTINGSTYATGDGKKNFFRMLAFKSPAPNKHYIVQLIAKDDAGNDINIYETNEKLVVMEYDITFLPERGASLLTEEKLYNDDNFKHARIEYLDETYGGANKQPSISIDFDEYIKINQLADETLKNKFVNTTSTTSTGMQKSYFKWPLEWSLSEYSFGYDDRQDYNMYMLATHSDVVPYKDASGEWNNNVEGDGKGLFDRLYYSTKRKIKNGTADQMQQGYYYYVNASTDPGVTARLRINSLCQGSTIHVSAWMSEFSKADETANLSFNFVAVLKDNIEEEHPSLGLGNGERIVLHQFITGYVPNDQRGQWLNIYYSFVPRLSDFASETLNATMVDHYEIELDNNAKNSSGADYAIDDIRAYVVPPTIVAKQLAPMCSDKELRIRVASPFDTLLELAGETEASTSDASKQISLYYTFINREEFDKQIAEVADEDLDTRYPEIFNDNLVQPMPNSDYNTIVFSSNYQKNIKYEYTDKYVASESAYRLRDEETGERYIVFENLVNESINKGLLNPGKEYYLVLNTGYGNDTPATKGVAQFFDLVSECASKCVMVITPSSIIKVNGIVETEKDKLVICENTSPVIQANVTGFNQSGEQSVVKKNAMFDWFLGTNKEYNDYEDKDGNLLASALQTIRARYPDDDITSIKADEASKGTETIEQWMIDIVKRASTEIDEDYGCARLILHQRSFIMPPVSIPSDKKEVIVNITAIPIPLKEEDMPENVLVCTDPSELTITIGHKAPLMRHGLKEITYPEKLVDVPLRIGLEQIREIKEGNMAMKTIEVPVRDASSPDPNVTSLGLYTEKRTLDNEVKDVVGCIVLVESDDPEYKAILDAENNKDVIEFPWVGDITSITADVKATSGNHFHMQFADDFDVKEGYYYKLRFDYEERVEDIKKSDAICNGQDLLTLKIVPKFQVWNGSENLNWNNDANWSRLDAAEINSGKKDDEHKHFVTDGANEGVKSYAPLDFTYVVIKDGVESPYLYAPNEEKKVKDDYNEEYTWPLKTEPKESASVDYSDYPVATPGAATQWIEYDMAAKTLAQAVDDVDIRCRPWYMNTCNEIHFKPGGTIMNQQLLAYKKAWVDVELDHSRWQTLSTPLKEVYAGDFYLPSKNARQETELFQPITFDNELEINNRFKPAVYQRGWDKATANVYELENQSFDSPRNVAVKTFWSHVYNDVTVEYGKGNGFSIKTDVSEMSDEISENSDYKVLFRLPKADDKYLYFTQDGLKSGHETTMTRKPGVTYKLNDSHGTITAVSAEKCSYFLVGNPFMTHMDIKEFISENSEKIDSKYWVITNTGQIAGEVDENGQFVAADPNDSEWAEDPTVIAPMQGFFVKAKNSATDKLELKYDESMMRRYDARDGKYLTSTTRSEEPIGMLKIVAQCDGFPATAALLATDTVGRSWIDVEAIDNRGLDVPATVYTAKNGKALSINCCADAEGIEIGVIADDETETILRFTGVEAVEGLCLLDKADHSLIPLEEGMEISVSGAAAGRYFLTYGIAGDGVMSGIEWSVNGGVLAAVDNAASGYMEVNVFDTVGRQLSHAATDEAEISVPIEKGIYVVEIKTAKERISIKVRV